MAEADASVDMGLTVEGGVAFDAEGQMRQLGVLTMDASVNGQPMDLKRGVTAGECAHRAVVNVQPVVAFIAGDPHPARIPVAVRRGFLRKRTEIEHVQPAPTEPGWQVRLRARCGECGQAFALALEGTAPQDGGPGTVLSMHPLED